MRRTGVLVWSMGITQHRFGGDGVQMILNLGLSRGYVGREKSGLMPIRGHSGVQGGGRWGAAHGVSGGKAGECGECGLSRQYGFEVPNTPGLTAAEMVEACARTSSRCCTASAAISCARCRARLHRRRYGERRCACTRTSFSPTNSSSTPPAAARRSSSCRRKRLTNRTTAAPRRRPSGGSASPADSPPGRRIQGRMEDLPRAAHTLEPDRQIAGLRDRLGDTRRDCAHNPDLRRHPIAQKHRRRLQYGGPHLCSGRRFPTPTARPLPPRPLPPRRRRENEAPSSSPPAAESSSTP